MALNQKIEKALLRLSRRNLNGRLNNLLPFGFLLYGFEIEELPENSEAIAFVVKERDNKYKIFVNPNKIENEEQAAFVLLHELMHVIMKHHFRLRGRDPELWNIACDHCINKLLVEEKNPVLEMIKGGVLIEEILNKNMSEEEVYEWLLEQHEKNPNKIRQLIEKLNKDLQGTGDGEGNLTEQDAEKIIEDLRGYVRLSESIGDGKGDGASKLMDEIKKLIEVKIPWDRLLDMAINTIMRDKNELTWTRPNIATRHLYKSPGTIESESPGALVIAIDQSGSMTDEDLAKAAYIVLNSKDYFGIIRILHHDTHVSLDVSLDNPEDVEKYFNKITSRGGTSHKEVFDRIEESYLEGSEEEMPSLILLFTDYCSDIEEIKNNYNFVKNVPIIFVLTEDVSPSFGHKIVINK